ncbi:gamma-glutamyl-gamma-aminobutyrate hydrolase family protein [Rhodococcus sp. IEGM 1381]|uniref:gamma-glutamyl-gamma-aminobutyrate hydrolase family protein n=1 Tax=Rhodococcus sp. IEGM 1381 TaxID=3047085 RepID=UPI0024B6FE57|nr:gamma-glutamyl-gamma-aminobutyrate hydrolase family protein [Rhodococcus sp. IEGM 1381]MDI9894522.1 gamma-glutamyl-gamma-aminobutyrate hydrolase family protein [Rhodococcus sp. IEGM 1381]
MTDSPTSAPRIGIPARLTHAQNDGDPRVAAAAKIFDDIVVLIEASGADCVVMTPEDLDTVLPTCNGVVLPGGGDVDPELYGEDATHPTLFGVDPNQDGFDSAVIRYALRTDTPMLGLCRGMQLLNVVAGGTLNVHMSESSVVHSAPVVTGAEMTEHSVTIRDGSICASVFDASAIDVSSAHHQSVARVAEGFTGTAYSADGSVEAIESTRPDQWAVGVQWHPESTGPHEELRRPLFDALRRAAEHRRSPLLVDG